MSFITVIVCHVAGNTTRFRQGLVACIFSLPYFHRSITALSPLYHRTITVEYHCRDCTFRSFERSEIRIYSVSTAFWHHSGITVETEHVQSLQLYSVSTIFTLNGIHSQRHPLSTAFTLYSIHSLLYPKTKHTHRHPATLPMPHKAKSGLPKKLYILISPTGKISFRFLWLQFAFAGH